MNRKGYFFIIDVAFAVIILVMGYMLLSSYDVEYQNDDQTAQVATDIQAFLNDGNMRDYYKYCSALPPPAKCGQDFNPLANGQRNPDYNLMETLIDLKEQTKDSNASGIFSQLVIANEAVNTVAYGVEFVYYTLNGEKRVYPEQDPSTTSAYKQSRSLISKKKIVMGYYENATAGTMSMWGPYVAEIRVWKK